MSSVAVEILLILVLILANGLFAMSEMAVVSVRKGRLQQRADEGDARARAALDLAESPTPFLSTVQIGVTTIGILAGAFGGATLAEELAAQLSRFPPLVPYSDAIAVGVVVVAIAYLSLVVGELAPKRVALSNAERIARAVARPMQVLSRIVFPLVRLLSLSTDLLLRLLRIRLPADLPVTEEEIKLLIEAGTEVGVFEPAERAMIERVLRLNDRPIAALATPRPEVVWLDADEPPEDLCPTIAAHGHSAFPVAQRDLDHVLGVVQAKDLLTQSLAGQPVELLAVMRPALFVPETMSSLDVLQRLREARSPLALVVDEYGGIQGLVTIYDILRSVVGDVLALDEAEEPEVIQREDGSWLLDGRLLVDDLKELLGLDTLPGDEAGYYQTLGGFVITWLQHIPSAGDHFAWGGYRFEVLDMDGHRVDKVLVLPEEAEV